MYQISNSDITPGTNELLIQTDISVLGTLHFVKHGASNVKLTVYIVPDGESIDIKYIYLYEHLLDNSEPYDLKGIILNRNDKIYIHTDNPGVVARFSGVPL